MSKPVPNPALDGIRIVDLTNGPTGGLTSMILADFGAQVISIAKPDHPINKLAAAPMWRRGKAEAVLDLNKPQALAQLHDLLTHADVLITTWRTKALANKGLAYEELTKALPHLVVCHISAFGAQGPMSDLPGYEHLVAAFSGRMGLFAGLADRSGPVFSSLQVGVHACSQSATAGILAALFDRQRTGLGCLVETSILRGLLAYEQGSALATQFQRTHPELPPVLPTPEQPPMPSLYYHPAQAGDGKWMQFGNLLPHLFDNFLLATDLIDIVADPDFDAKQLLLPKQKHETFRARMLHRIQQRSADEWMHDFIADGGIVATTYETTQQALDNPDIVANGHVIEVEPEHRQLGPLARLSKNPAAPAANDMDSQSLTKTWQIKKRISTRPSIISNDQGPLAGLKVVELATIIAAPLGATFLADMGAEVIKVEQLGGDPYRSMASGIGSARVNAGKRSISVDLKSDLGKQVVSRLLQDADVLIHNFRPGVPERLGIGYEQVAHYNPNIIYLQSNGYGPDGPSAHRPSTHPIPGAAMGGVMYQMGERLPGEVQDIEGLRLWTRRLMRANEVNPDPNTALVITTSVLMGVMAREIHGHGQQILVDMFGANAYANHDDFLSYPSKPKRLLPDTKLLGLSPTYRLYPCANQEWIFIAAVTPQEKSNLQAALSDHATQITLSEQHLSDIFIQSTAQFWCNALLPLGVGCVRADGHLPAQFWLDEALTLDSSLMSQAHHPRWGAYLRHGAMQTFSSSSKPLAPPPLAGQHNQELLSELGFTEDQIDQMVTAGVLWQET